jgi:hypothetical protein
MNTDKIYAEHIVNEYSKKEESKVVALKKLDNLVKLPGKVFAYSFGVVMALVLGVGMCFAMGVIGNKTVTSYAIGIVIGVIGIIGVSVNYPIFNLINAKRKEKYAADILRLAKEIEDEEEAKENAGK